MEGGTGAGITGILSGRGRRGTVTGRHGEDEDVRGRERIEEEEEEKEGDRQTDQKRKTKS
jgi:hypothetical protein